VRDGENNGRDFTTIIALQALGAGAGAGERMQEIASRRLAMTGQTV